jgi:guanosine-3',5'-bis(diphosphate) 3'-pyrophosphohydrolase
MDMLLSPDPGSATRYPQVAAGGSVVGLTEPPDPAVALLKAMHFAADMHKTTIRKGAAKEPYVNHVIEVAELLARVGGVTDLATLQAALLHDVVEDTSVTFADIEQGFGQEVRRIVEEITDDKRLPKEMRKQLQVDKAARLSKAAKMIRIADKASNVKAIMLSPPAEWSAERRSEYVAWSERVIEGCRGVNQRLEEYYDNAVRECRRALASIGP